MYTRASDSERPEKVNKCRTGRKQEKVAWVHALYISKVALSVPTNTSQKRVSLFHAENQ